MCLTPIQKARVRRARVDKLTANLQNKLSIFTEAAKGPEDKVVGGSFKVNSLLPFWLSLS